MADVPDLSGQTCLVTGANTGIGLEVSRALASRGARVILACRSLQRGQAARDKLMSDLPAADLRAVALDLASLGSINAAVEEVASEADLGLLVNNAGVMGRNLAVTEDGFEAQMGVNHLGHFALTLGLLPKLEDTPGARVVTVSSLAHRQGQIDLEDLRENQGRNAKRPYASSKLANLLFAFELQRRLREVNARTMSIACHPGASATDIVRHMPAFVSSLLPLMALVLNTPAQGALPVLRAATDSQVVGGEYFGPTGIGELRHSAGRVSSSQRAQDVELARALWRSSEALTGVSWP